MAVETSRRTDGTSGRASLVLSGATRRRILLHLSALSRRRRRPRPITAPVSDGDKARPVRLSVGRSVRPARLFAAGAARAVGSRGGDVRRRDNTISP